MGLRGPGAKPVKRFSAQLAPKIRRGRAKKPAWERKGLKPSDRVIAFVESLKVTAGTHAGKLIKLREWQRAIIRAIYDPAGEDGLRLIRQALVTMPRKNGKTGLAAPLALCHLAGPMAEARGQVFSAAADRNQAAILYREMRAMIEVDEALSARIIVRDFNKHLEDSVTGSTYYALSADAKTKHGFSASFVVYDELAQAPNRNLFDVLSTSTAARDQPLVMVISTQSSDPHHVMSELVEHGRKVNDGLIDDPHFHATIYAAPMDADIWDEAVWFACNPALGDFRSLPEMRSYAAQAKLLPARETAFRALYLNQPVEEISRFISLPAWRACQSEIDLDSLRGKACWAGLDLSSTTDLTALALYFETGESVVYFWVPRDRLQEREKTDRVPYATWHRQGFIEAPEGRAIDIRAIARRLAEITQHFNLQGVAYDRWHIEVLKRILSDEGLDLPLVDWGQGFQSMGPAVDALEVIILEETLRHDGNPVLTWCASNAAVAMDPAGNRKLDKARSVERIDGMVALAMAVGLHAKKPKEAPRDFTGMAFSVG